MLAKVQKHTIARGTAKGKCLPILKSVVIGETHNGGFSRLRTFTFDYQVSVLARDLDSAPREIVVDKKTTKECFGFKWTSDGCDKDTVLFKQNGTSRTAPTKPMDEFPSLVEPAGGYWQSLDLDFNLFKSQLSYLSKIKSTDLTRPSLCGIYLETYGDSTYSLTATDGHVLAKVQGKAESITNKYAILDGSACDFIAGLPVEKGMECLLHLADDKILAEIHYGDCQVRILMINQDTFGKYPDYRNVIPKDSEGHITIEDAAAFLAACKAIKPNTSKAVNQVVFNFTAMELTCDDPDTGKSSVSIGDIKYTHWSIDKAGFNVSNLIRIVPPWWAGFTFHGKSKDTAFTVYGLPYDDTTAIIMPLRLDAKRFPQNVEQSESEKEPNWSAPIE